MDNQGAYAFRQDRSPSIGKLAEALSKAQGTLKNAPKTSANPFYQSHYADLATVWDSCREALSSNGLCVIQLSAPAQPGKLAIETVLAHASGEWISGTLELSPVKGDPQAYGSAITYARRYGLQAIVGIASEDDDGNEASVKPEYPKATAETVAANVRRNRDPKSYEKKVTAEQAEALAEPPVDEERPAILQKAAPEAQEKFQKILDDFKKAGLDGEKDPPDKCECGSQIVRETGRKGDFFTCATSFAAFKDNRQLTDGVRHYWRRA